MSCARSGMCCKILYITYSPRELRESLEHYQKTGNEKQQDVGLIAPMLEGRCLGKRIHDDGSASYCYGPCKNLVFDKETSLPTCNIQASKPRMCSGYPYYGKSELGDFKLARGCGFNKTEQGYLYGDLRVLSELSEDEK